jgi:hypothetical protein
MRENPKPKMRYMVTGERMTIDVLWYFDKAEWVWPNYRDGVRAAMEVLEDRDHTVRWHLGLDPQVPADSNFILIWAESTTPAIEKVKDHPAKKGLLLTTDLGLSIEHLRAYDVVFAEAQPVVDAIKPHGIHVVKAFGTDTEFFSPITNARKEYEAFYPATFSPWKRQNLFADKWLDKGLCMGTVQPDGFDILRHVVEAKTHIYLGYAPAERVRDFYRRSRVVDITGWEGSGRTVIEGLSMGMAVRVSPDNHKCLSYLKEWEKSGLTPREFAQKYYSEEVYADQLLKGMA